MRVNGYLHDHVADQVNVHVKVNVKVDVNVFVVVDVAGDVVVEVTIDAGLKGPTANSYALKCAALGAGGAAPPCRGEWRGARGASPHLTRCHLPQDHLLR